MTSAIAAQIGASLSSIGATSSAQTEAALQIKAKAKLDASLSSTGDASSAQNDATLKIKAKAKVAARDFESMFLNTMFQQMFTGIDGDGPFGGSGALRVWRSFLTDQYAKSFAKNGGIGIASHVYDTLLKQQGVSAS